MSGSSYFKEVDFLPKGATLMARVKLSDKLDRALRQEVNDHSQRLGFLRGKQGVPITLEENLRIQFSLSAKWNIQRELLPCKCSIPVGNKRALESINSAFQQITEVVEPYRKSRGGAVYGGICCVHPSKPGQWQTLGSLRNIVYEPHRRTYEDAVQKYKNGTPAFIRSPDRFADFLLAHQKELIAALGTGSGQFEGRLREIGGSYRDTALSRYRQKVEELESMLRVAIDEATWQDWIYKNSWMFASQYAAPLPKERVGFSSIPDFIFPTLDGFLDAFEIKTPEAKIIIEDNSHPGAYRWSSEASAAIGQATLYRDEIERNRLVLTERIEDKYGVRVSTIRPRALILMGRSDTWKRPELDAFRRLSDTLHGIEIISYTSLLRRAKGLLSLFEEDALRD